MRIVVHGISHHATPLDVRERAAFLAAEVPDALAELRRTDEVAECALVSTCNRTELYALAADPEAAAAACADLVRRRKGVDPAAAGSYTHVGRDGVQHLFRVASGADSMVLGEAAILGQVKQAYDAALDSETLGPVLGRLFPAALHAGKRARTETAIGRGAVSLEKSSVQLAEKVWGNLEKRRALVVGAGDSGQRVAELLAEAGVREFTFTNRTRGKAEELAALRGGRATDLACVPVEIARTDILVSAVAAAEPVLAIDTLRPALAGRRRGPLLVLDLGVPRSVAPEARDIASVFLYCVDDLRELIDVNLEQRRRELPAVEAIVADETERFERWMLSLQTAPVVVAMREEADRIRREALHRFARGRSPEERELLEKFSNGLVNKLLHEPTVTVRECDPETHEGLRGLHWTRRLFGLDGGHGRNGAGPE